MQTLKQISGQPAPFRNGPPRTKPKAPSYYGKGTEISNEISNDTSKSCNLILKSVDPSSNPDILRP